MKKKIFIPVGVVAIAAILLLALKPFSKKDESVSFETVKVQKGSLSNTVTATGTIQAIKSITVGTQVSGIIQHIYVDFNNRVRQGQVLAKLDTVPLKSQLDQSQSALDMAQAQLNYQEANFRRLKVLFDKNLVSQADYDQAVYNYQNAKANLSNAKSGLTRAKVNLDYATIISPIDGVVLNRAVEEGQTVAASFSTPTLFTIVNDVTQMQVQTSVDEADIGKVKEGQRVEFTVDAYPDMKFNGEVSQVRLQPVTTNNVVTYVVIMKAPNPDGKLMPGMTASTTIYVDEKQDALYLPGKAVRFKPSTEYMQKMFQKMMAERSKNGSQVPSGMPSGMPSGSGMPAGGQMPSGAQMPGMPSLTGNSSSKTKTVWVKDDKMGLRPAFITVGIDNGTNLEVVSGLKENDEVIVAMNTGKKKASASTNSGPRGPFPF
ncbi:MAG TPA: efflux RND transporter periplasmic adaptor subunit [Bacteroidales bacterium]|nr:efflux RND transporter periplasmic adaptor subunit [Bacteroidales bacterium]